MVPSDFSEKNCVKCTFYANRYRERYMLKRKKKREKQDSLELEFTTLVISQLRHEKKMHKEAMRLEKKRKLRYIY